MSDYLTPAEVSEKLSIPMSTLTQWRHRGRGPAYTKIASTVRYSADELDAYLNANTITFDGGAA